MVQPYIVRCIRDDDKPKYFLMVENNYIGPVEKYREAVITLLASYYTFNIEYPKLLRIPMKFIQHVILNIHEEKVPPAVTSHATTLIMMDEDTEGKNT